jgi:predicted GTPase
VLAENEAGDRLFLGGEEQQKVIFKKNEIKRVYKTVTVKKIEKIKGKKVTVITHKQELVKVWRTVVIG